MGIFSRFVDIVQANVNDALDRAEDPDKMIKQMIIEMEEALTKASSAVAQAMANERNTERQRDKARADATDWERKAGLALGAGNEALARQALANKMEADRRVVQYEALLEQSRATTAKLRQQLDGLKARLDEARMKESTLLARSRAADSQKVFAEATGGFGDGAFAKFEKMERKIEGKEAEAQSLAQVTGAEAAPDPFAELEKNARLDDELAKLRQKMGT